MEHAIIVGASVIAAAITISLAAFAAARGDSEVASKAIESIARQPEMRQPIMVTMLIAIGLIEAIPIIAVVIALVLVFANPFIQ